MSGAPDPKSRTLARGERRYRRKVASPKQWQAIIAAKRGPCRVCGRHIFLDIDYHHIVARSRGGDDVADNLVPLCGKCHYHITDECGVCKARLGGALTDAEYAYVVGKLGEGGMERLFGVGVSR